MLYERMAVHSLIISRLIESGYQVFIPLGGDSSELLLITSEGKNTIIKKCKARTASIDEGNSSVLKISDGAFDILAAFDPISMNVWAIPRDILENRKAIRLGKRYDDYLIPEPVSEAYRDRKKVRRGFLDDLKEQARDIGMKEKGKDEKSSSDIQKD